MATQELVQRLQVFTSNGTTYESTGSSYATYDDIPAAAYDSLFINNFYQATLASVVSSSIYSNASSLYAPTVTKGAVNLSPSLYSNSNTFYPATVVRGQVTLTANRYDNAQTFYAPTVSQGTVTLVPAHYENSNTFFQASATCSDVQVTGGSGKGKQRRVYLEEDGKILVFANASRASAYLAKKKQQNAAEAAQESPQSTEKIKAVTKQKKKEIEPLQAISIDVLQLLSIQYGYEDTLSPILKQNEYAALIALYEQVMLDRDEEEVLMLLLA